MYNGQFIGQAERLVASAHLGDRHPGGRQGAATDVRTAVSRAYYHAFHAAMALLEELGYRPTETGNDHLLATLALQYAGRKDLGKAGSELGALATDRRRADYRMDSPAAERVEVAEKAVRLAKQIYSWVGVARVEVAGNPEAKRAIADAIDRWNATYPVKLRK